MNITYDKNCPLPTIYIRAFQDAVLPILKRIGRDFHEVKWIIYDCDRPPIPKSQKQIVDLLPQNYRLFCLPKEHYYGFCCVPENNVYISTATIQDRLLHPQNLYLQNLYPQREKISLFAKVVTDELAHIATQADHGTERYEDTLSEYRLRCQGL